MILIYLLTRVNSFIGGTALGFGLIHGDAQLMAMGALIVLLSALAVHYER